MRSFGRILIALLTALGCVAAVSGQDMDLINATVIDGTGSAPRAGVSVIVCSGRIEQSLGREPTADRGSTPARSGRT